MSILEKEEIVFRGGMRSPAVPSLALRDSDKLPTCLSNVLSDFRFGRRKVIRVPPHPRHLLAVHVHLVCRVEGLEREGRNLLVDAGQKGHRALLDWEWLDSTANLSLSPSWNPKPWRLELSRLRLIKGLGLRPRLHPEPLPSENGTP